MRYTVNYSGAFFTDDNNDFNIHWFPTWSKARDVFYALHEAGFSDVYVRDEEYQCTFRFDPRDNDFVWEG